MSGYQVISRAYLLPKISETGPRNQKQGRLCARTSSN